MPDSGMPQDAPTDALECDAIVYFRVCGEPEDPCASRCDPAFLPDGGGRVCDMDEIGSCVRTSGDAGTMP